MLTALLAMPIVTYNGLAPLGNRYQNAFAQIDAQLQRYYELIPNLEETAKASLGHERETLQSDFAAS